MKGIMEPIEVEQYLETLGPDLRLQLCKVCDDDDVYQQASLDLYRDCARYVCDSEMDFTRLFCRYFLTIRSRWRHHQGEKSETVKHYSLEEYRDSMGTYQLNHYSNDPREDVRVVVKDYIALLPMAYRPIFVLMFIEGYTYEETAEHMSMSTMNVHKLVQDGVEWIRDELKAIG